MRLLKCWEISDKRLREVLKKLPSLEEFEISFSHLLPTKDKCWTYIVGLLDKCCVHLKVLKFNMKEQKSSNMMVRHLLLQKPCLNYVISNFWETGSSMNNEGLLSILDGCPHLESLDLHARSNVDLSRSLKERC
ncbi:F-box protein SKIP19-like [Lotus japonicus]|uniref:F-box protein SKIP19-like n=1 Tax=Lotus japonicus TaxID=34305 RepID=UPI002583E1E0|nr:F-box protein SKIP19-like [Lotus japonicus]